MKGISIAGNSDATLIAVASLAFVGLFLFLKNQGAAAAKAIGNVNAGTPYAGAGAVGTLGNATNSILGGAPAAVGSSLAGAIYNFLNPYDPNNNGPTHKQAVADNVAVASGNAPFIPVAEPDPYTTFGSF